jgi:hypothetical protein
MNDNLVAAQIAYVDDTHSPSGLAPLYRHFCNLQYSAALVLMSTDPDDGQLHTLGLRVVCQRGLTRSRFWPSLVCGRTTKIHAIVDSKGRPQSFTVTGGQVHDSQVVEEILKHTSIAIGGHGR